MMLQMAERDACHATWLLDEGVSWREAGMWQTLTGEGSLADPWDALPPMCRSTMVPADAWCDLDAPLDDGFPDAALWPPHLLDVIANTPRKGVPLRCRLGLHDWSRWCIDDPGEHPGSAARICQRDACRLVQVRPVA
jgi:hypothetical protein